MKRRLLERLADNIQMDMDSLVLSVSTHLQQLLNTRHGSCLTRRDMGLPSISPLSLHGDDRQLIQLSRVIQQQVKSFEPRLSKTQLSLDSENQQQLVFRLLGDIRFGYESVQVDLRLFIDSDGIVDVRVEHYQRVDFLEDQSNVSLQKALNVSR
jgi:type VI secretion system lysozyme-like protein